MTNLFAVVHGSTRELKFFETEAARSEFLCKEYREPYPEWGPVYND